MKKEIKQQMRPIKITEEVVTEFIDLVRSGQTMYAASKQIGFKIDGIRKAAERLNIAWPKRSELKIDQMKARRDEIIASDHKHSYWAEEFQTTEAYISKAFTELGIIEQKKIRNKGKHLPSKLADARRVIGYIAENGGNVINAMNELNIKNRGQAQYIRDFAKEIGFDTSLYTFAWRRYGEWLTIPGPIKRLNPATNVMAPAICTSCCHMKELNISNAESGRTNKCQVCAQGNGHRTFYVIDTETNEKYRSIMSFVNAMKMTGSYQKVRVQLISKGFINIRGTVYMLAQKEPKDAKPSSNEEIIGNI